MSIEKMEIKLLMKDEILIFEKGKNPENNSKIIKSSDVVKMISVKTEFNRVNIIFTNGKEMKYPFSSLEYIAYDNG